MAFCCSYSALLNKATSPCGLSNDYPGQLECVPLKDCTKDVTGHLKSFKLSNDKGARTEMKLLSQSQYVCFQTQNAFLHDFIKLFTFQGRIFHLTVRNYLQMFF